MVDSNITALRIAAEQTLGVLPGTPVWRPYEPNAYNDFGSEFMSEARSPITPSRQRRKGALVGEEASAGFDIDWTQSMATELLPGFMFAAWRRKTNLVPSAVSATLYTVPSGGAGFLVNSLLWGAGFAVAGNNGLKVVTASAGTTVTAAGLAIETPPASALITRVGHQGASGDITVTVSSGIATLGSTALNFTTLGLIPGEWIYIGGDAAGTKFNTAANNGWARIKTIAANAIVLDRQPATMVTDAGAAKTIQLFFGHVIKNESDPLLIVRTSYQLERDLGLATDEYVVGAVPSELEISVTPAQKVVAKLSFSALSSSEAATKSGTRPTLVQEAPFTASNDFSRLRLLNEVTQASLGTYVEELKLTISNNLSMDKAIGYLGAFDITAGDFEVNGEVKAYFADFLARDAIRANTDVSLDFAMVMQNAGWLFDVPLVTLGNSRLEVSKDQSVKLPLSADAVAHPTLDHTLLIQQFTYLPSVAN